MHVATGSMQLSSCVCAVARTIVTMEQTYVTAAFFRHLTVERHRQRVAALYDEGHQQLVSGTCSSSLMNPFPLSLFPFPF